MARTQPPLEVSILGPVAARREGAELSLGGRRQRAVLARLALGSGEAVPAGRIIDELWSGDPPRSATNTLQSYVSNLRRILGGGDGGAVIERTGEAYRLSVGPDGLVADRFARLTAEAAAVEGDAAVALLDRALGLWHGPALGDLADEAWAEGEATRLEELRLGAMEARFDALLAAGRHGAAAADLEVAATAHPLRERFAAQLVLALYRCGRQAEALRAYERTRAHLADELGLDPGPALAQLADAVLAQDPGLDPPVPAPSAPAPAAPADPPTPVVASPSVDLTSLGLRPELPLLDLPPAAQGGRERSDFVGRAAELQALEDRWRAVVEGDRRLVTLSGEPGVGKTRLVQRFARRVHHQGGQVLWGRCAAENLIAFQPLAEAMRTAVRELPDEVVRSVIDVRPPLRLVLHDPADLSRPDRSERFDLYESLADLFGEMSEVHPVLLVVDDLQWADPSTTGLLRQVLLHHRSGRLLVVATVRRPAGRPTDDVDLLLTDLHRDHRVDALAVEGLPHADVAALLSARGVALDDDEVETVRTRTGGNPFFVESLIDQGGDLAPDDGRALPDSVRDVLDQRLAGLDAAASQVLSAAAVIGLRIELDLLGQVTGVDPDALLDLVDPAVAAGLLAEDEDLGWVTFPHALVRQALIARTTRNREARIHLAVADALEARPDLADRSALLAQHLRAAGRACPPVRAARAAVAAGREALGRLADAEARTWALRALEALEAVGPGEDEGVGPEADLLLVAASRNLADLEVAGEAVGRLVARARAEGDGPGLARAAHERAQLQAGVGFLFGAVDEEVVGLLAEATAALPGGHPAERSILLSWTSINLTGVDDQEVQAVLAAEAWDLAQRVEDRPDVLALAAYARRLALGGPDDMGERRDLGPLMLAAARRARWPEMEVVALLFGTIDLLEEDRLTESLASLEEMRRHLSAGDRPMFDVYLHFLDAGFALLRGDLATAQAHSDRGLEIGAAAHGDNATQAWAAQQFLLATYRGTVAELTDVVADMAERFPTMPAWKAALATCLLGAGDVDGTREAARSAFVGDELPLRQNPTWYTTVAQLAEVAWNVDDAELARRLLPLLDPVADRVAITGMGAICLGHLTRPRGLVRAVLGDLDGAVDDLERACARSADCGFAPWLARAQVELAEVLERRDRAGDRARAAELRVQGTALAESLGIRVRLSDL